MPTLKINIPEHPELDADYWRKQLRRDIMDKAFSYIDDNQELVNFESEITVEVE